MRRSRRRCQNVAASLIIDGGVNVPPMQSLAALNLHADDVAQNVGSFGTHMPAAH